MLFAARRPVVCRAPRVRSAPILAPILASLLALAPVPAVSAAQSPPTHASASVAREAFLAAHPGAGLFFDEPERGGAISRVYGSAFSRGSNPVDSAERFLRAHAGMLSSDFSELLPVGPNGDGTHVLPLGYDQSDGSFRFSLVGYTQHVNGIPVFRSDVRLLVRNEPGYPLVLVSNALRDVRAFAATFHAKPVPPSKIDVERISRRALNQFGPGATVSEQEQVVWAGYDGAPAATPRLAYAFIVTGTAVFDRTAKQRMLYVVDAADSRILFQEDQIVHNDIQVTVQGNATTGFAADACGPEATVPLPYARVLVGSTPYYANAAGFVAIPNPSNAEVTVTSNLFRAGLWFWVTNSSGDPSFLTTSTSGGTVDFLHNASNADDAERAQVNAYIHANIVRDYLLSYNPAFPTIPAQTGFPINVMLAQICNAYYDGVSINFYAAGGGCNNTAFGTIVHHEYGHHIVKRAGSGQAQYGEGFSDAMAALVTDDPRVAVGFQNCAAALRTADNSNQYSEATCSTSGGSYHTCGTLFSGCVWSTRTYLAASNPTTYRQIISNLTIDSVLLHTGVSITPAITIDFLTLDDNDANIGNGTPHYHEIQAGFGDHGMPGPVIPPFEFVYPNGRPEISHPTFGVSLPVQLVPLVGAPQPGTGRLFYRMGTSGAFAEVAMQETAPNRYLVELPPAPCNTTIQYYVAARSTSGAWLTHPSGAPTSAFSVVAATSLATPFADSVETDLGWTLGIVDDTASTGQWTRGDPNGTTQAGVRVQPEDDVTTDPGVNCFFTGQADPSALVAVADVDEGTTTLVSPPMNALGGTARLSYYRWYSNARGGPAPNADVFRVQISNDGGANWVPLETVGPTGPEVDGGWIFKEFRVSDFIVPTANMRLRFIAEDAGTASLIEAAVDEVRLRVFGCVLPGDIDGDGSVGGSDLALLLSNWGAGGPTDIDGDGTTDGTDLALLLAYWR